MTHNTRTKLQSSAVNANLILVFATYQLEDWHSKECKLTPTLTFGLLTSNEMGETRTCHVISRCQILAMICPVVFVLKC